MPTIKIGSGEAVRDDQGREGITHSRPFLDDAGVEVIKVRFGDEPEAERYRVGLLTPIGALSRDATPRTHLFEKNLCKHSQGRYTAEASELRWPIGQWPQSVVIGSVTLHQSKIDRDGEGDTRLVEYRGRDVVVGEFHLTVFND